MNVFVWRKETDVPTEAYTKTIMLFPNARPLKIFNTVRQQINLRAKAMTKKETDSYQV